MFHITPSCYLEIPKVPFTGVAIDMISKLPVTTSGNKYALTCIDLLTSYVVAVPMPDKTAESVVEAYLSSILSRTGASMVCLSDNGPLHPQGNSCIENVHNFLKRTLTKFLSSTDIEWDKILPFACYFFNTTLTADDVESPFFLVHRRDPLEGCTGLLGPGTIRYLGDNKGLILFTKLHKLLSAHTRSLQENRLLKQKKLKRTKILKHTIIK